MAAEVPGTVRRAVAGVDEEGRSTLATDGFPSNYYAMASAPGFSRALIWSTVAEPVVPPSHDPAPSTTNFHPSPGETRCLLLTLPPDSVLESDSFDPEAFAREGLEHNAGIFDRMEAENPGWHRTDTIDYNVVVAGEIWLALDDGTETRFGRGDVIVQTGTRHAWRNKSDQPATLFSVLVGARRNAL